MTETSQQGIDSVTLRRAVARVDVSAITENVERLRDELKTGAELCAVVKADGYGHGIEQTAAAAVAGGATRLAVVTPTEAAVVSALELGVPVLLLAPVPEDDLIAAVATGAELTAWTPELISAIGRVGTMLGQAVKIHVKLDTGMGRFGAKTDDDAMSAIAFASETAAVEPVAVWTHFATADEPGDDYFGAQLARFTAFVAAAKAEYPSLLAHAANSAAILRDSASHFDFVRPGIAIYGLDPFHKDASARGLRPALTLHSYVASVRPLAAGESTGYGRRFIAESDTQIATIPFGYGDGWPRRLTNDCDVLIAGKRYPQCGTISMDSLTVDLGADSTIDVGAPVTLIGGDGGERITTEEVAERAETINYEITCGLTARTQREYVKKD
jgi:alanine racemase